MRIIPRMFVAVATLALVAACGGEAPPSPAAQASAAKAFVWPASLKVVGDGFPERGAPCRRMGESAATADFLDDRAALVGCPSAADAEALGGKMLSTIDGVTLVSVPESRGPLPGDGDGQGDAKVAGTDYDATASVPCGGYRGIEPTTCEAGVKRNTEGGLTLVLIDYPDGVNSRMLMFDQTGKVVSANTNEADGSSQYDVVGKREGDTTIVTIGPERYEVPEVFLTGD